VGVHGLLTNFDVKGAGNMIHQHQNSIDYPKFYSEGKKSLENVLSLFVSVYVIEFV